MERRVGAQRRRRWDVIRLGRRPFQIESNRVAVRRRNTVSMTGADLRAFFWASAGAFGAACAAGMVLVAGVWCESESGAGCAACEFGWGAACGVDCESVDWESVDGESFDWESVDCEPEAPESCAAACRCAGGNNKPKAMARKNIVRAFRLISCSPEKLAST